MRFLAGGVHGATSEAVDARRRDGGSGAHVVSARAEDPRSGRRHTIVPVRGRRGRKTAQSGAGTAEHHQRAGQRRRGRRRGGDQLPAFGCVARRGCRNPSKRHRRLQLAAGFGSTALMAQKWPPSSSPVTPLSPKKTTLPVPSGSTTTGEAFDHPAGGRSCRWGAPVVASRAWRDAVAGAEVEDAAVPGRGRRRRRPTPGTSTPRTPVAAS